MGPPASPSPNGDTDDGARWRSAGERIQTLLDGSAAGGSAAHERAEQLVREVTELYGAALERMMRLAVDAKPDLAEAFTNDDLIASLLLVHGLHPHSVERRVANALDTVRPYLGSHGGDVSLFEVDGDVVRLAFSGSCKGCPSSAVTLELAVEDAVRAAAPEIATIEVVSPEHNSSAIIPAESLFGRVRASGQRTSSWHPVTELNDLRDGEIGGFLVAGATVVVCRVGQNLFAYHDRCGECAQSMAGAALDGAVLRCPICHAAFDVVHAGASVTGTGHLEPIPLLTHDGVLSMAVVETVSP